VRKAFAILGSAIFLVVAPGVVAGFVPWTISRWEFDAPFFGLAPLRFAGGALIALGLAGLLECFGRFALQGIGTPAPVFPTRHLVVMGFYRHVRNPMYISVVAAILGQALLFGNVALLEYGAIVWLLFHLFVLLYEEPTLRASFGPEYQSFCAEVPRWIPRFTRPPARRSG
jgi:protein-S-isoprenylcysteine O-methyltransferase Ste14